MDVVFLVKCVVMGVGVKGVDMLLFVFNCILSVGVFFCFSFFFFFAFTSG